MGKPCVISLPFGGLGNQMFIYAFCKALAERNGVELRVNTTSGFEHDPVYQRRFMLHHLIPEFVRSGRRESRNFKGGRMFRSLERRVNRLLPLERRHVVEEVTSAFDAGMRDFKVTRPTVFTGLWHSYRYFENLDMNEVFSFPDELVRPLAEEAEAIRSANAVCLAVRRYEEVNRRGPRILGEDYFAKAMARIEEEVENPHYFVFAQNKDWVREHIHSRHPMTFAAERDTHEGAIQDLYLMTQCKRFIISNSTLHWWAAWLGAGKEGKVIAPDKNCWAADALPDSWIRMD